MPYCGNCGKKLKDDSLFCGFCGAPVEPEEVVEQVSNTQSDSSYMNVSQNTVQADFSTNFEKKPEKGKKAVKGLIVAIVILGILVLLAISFAVVIMVKGYDLSDIDSIKSDLFKTSEDSEISNEETQDESETSDIETTDTDVSSTKAAHRVDSIVKEEKWKPTSMGITIDFVDDNSSISNLFVFSYDGDRLKNVSQFNDEVNIEYDVNGNCIRYYGWEYNIYGLNLVGENYYYDDNNFVIKEERSDGMYYSIYQNDVNGNHIHTDFYETYRGETKLYMTDDSTFDELNRIVTSHRYNIGGRWTDDYTYYYSGTNAEPDYYTSVIEELDSSEKRTYTYSFKYEYDNQGRLIEKVEEHRDDNNKIIKIITFSYGYDADNTEIIVSDPVDISYLVQNITSSTIDDESYGNNYFPSQIMDGDLDTSWAEGVEGNGIGEYIEFSIPRGTVISEMVIYTGYCKSSNVFYKNGAPSVVDVYSGNDGYRINLNSADTQYAAEDYDVACEGVRVTFPSPIVSNGKLRITIVDVRDGESWDDTNISEVSFYGSSTNKIEIPDWYVVNEVAVKDNEVCFSRDDGLVIDGEYPLSVTHYIFNDDGSLYSMIDYIVFKNEEDAKEEAEELSFYGDDGRNGFGMHEGESFYYSVGNIMVVEYLPKYTQQEIGSYQNVISMFSGYGWKINYIT